MTFVEGLAATAVGGLLLATVTSFFLFSNRSFAVLASYADLERENRNALSLITRDIRQATALGSLDIVGNARVLLVLDHGGTAVAYQYHRGNRTLSRAVGDHTAVILTGCDDFAVFLYEPDTGAGAYGAFPASDVSNCKLIQVDWTASRSLLGVKLTSQTARSAKVVIRKA
jgi:hypothetical protein